MPRTLEISMRYETTVPFDGFYDSLSSMDLDDALKEMFSDRLTGFTVNEGLVMRAWDKMDWRQVRIDYAKDYLENFGLWLGLDLEWYELVSPREYNFRTDVIVATISEESLLKAFANVDKGILVAVAKRRHTSYDGFHSYYSPNIEDWPESVLGWDSVQIGTLLYALAEDVQGEEFGAWEQYYVNESSRSNGVYEEILSRNCPEMERLTKVHEYLEARAKREEVVA